MTLALALTIMMTFTTFSLAECPDNCPDPEPVVECPDGNCDGAFADAWMNGNTFGETDLGDGNNLWATGCTSLEIGTIAGAPMDGSAAITNIAQQGLDIYKERADGTAGFKLQDVTKVQLDTEALNGGLEGGFVGSENHANVDMNSAIWNTGLEANMNGDLSMAGIVCVTPGTSGTLESQMLTQSFQDTDNGNGIKTSQQWQALGTLKINANEQP